MVEAGVDPIALQILNDTWVLLLQFGGEGHRRGGLRWVSAVGSLGAENRFAAFPREGLRNETPEARS